MKNVILYFLLFVLVGGCKAETQGGERVINVSMSEYLTRADVDEMAVPTKESSDTQVELMNYLRENYYDPSVSSDEYRFRLLVNEDGGVDRIILIDGADTEEKEETILSYIDDYKFKPAIKDGKPVKYRHDIEFEIAEYRMAVDEMPIPVGGIKAIQEKVNYPELAKRAGIEGRVFVRAYIAENGVVQKTEVIRSPHDILEESARQAVLATKFNPGVHEGKPVKVQVVVPILFKLGSK